MMKMKKVKIELTMNEIEELVSEFDKLRLIDKYKSALEYMASPIGKLIGKLGPQFRQILGVSF